MFTQTITLPIFIIVLLILAGAAIGYAVRAGQRLRMRTIIDELEEEKQAGYSRILELEKETLGLETRLREWTSPVVPFKKTSASAAEEATPKITSPDMSLRKQLLRKDDKNRHSASR